MKYNRILKKNQVIYKTYNQIYKKLIKINNIYKWEIEIYKREKHIIIKIQQVVF